jgi:hypothetical protein
MVDLLDLQCVMNKSFSRLNTIVIDRFVTFLSQKGIDVDKDIVAEFQQQLPRQHFHLVGTTKRKETKGQRTPNSYNMFIRDKMREIKTIQPTLTGKELLKHATQEWNKYKLEKNNVPIIQDNV